MDAVLRSGVTRVVVALTDPDPRVAGRGIAQLRAAGLEVVEDVAAAEARRDHLGHVRRVTTGRPMVTVKMAETADGFAAAPAGEPRLMITEPVANAAVQMMRATHDGIMVGRGTAVADDPVLSVRLPGWRGRPPTRIALDRHLSLPVKSKLVARSGPPVLVFAGPAAPAERERALSDLGVTVSRVPLKDGGLDLQAVLRELGSRGFTRILCEGGPHVASALIEQALADRVVTLASPVPLARSGLRAFSPEARARLEQSYEVLDEAPLRPDVMRVYEAVGV